MLAGTAYFINGKTVVMRSTDHGATFSRITDVSSSFRVHGNGMGRGNGEKLQVDPGNGNVLYVGSRRFDVGATRTFVESMPGQGGRMSGRLSSRPCSCR